MSDNSDILADIMKSVYIDGGKTCLPCAAAFQIADRHSIEPGKIGVLCNENGIRISRCQLGCFP